MTSNSPAKPLASEAPTSSVAPELWRPFVVGALCAAVLALPVLACNAWEASLDAHTRLVPVLLQLKSIALFLPVFSLGVVARVAARSAWPVARALPSARRAGWLFALMASQLALVVVCLGVGVFSQKNWSFSTPTPFASERSPDGLRTAYATQECMLGCSVVVHVREGAAFVMHEARRYDHFRGENARIVWQSAAPGGVEVQGLTPMPPGHAFGGWH